MDVSCGVGLFSLFAVKAGARRVIAIESSKIAELTKRIMIDNKVDHIVTVVRGEIGKIDYHPCQCT
jgi:predicted RNA methylase